MAQTGKERVYKMQFTKDMKLKEILSQPEFDDFRDYLFWQNEEEAPEVWNGAMSQFEPRWNAAVMCGGLERIRQLRRAGKKVFYPLYDAAEAAARPELKKQAMFHFSIERKTKFAVVCAGGGYGAVCSMVEAFPTAKILNEMGYHAFVVNYRVGKSAKAPNPQEDLAKAVRFILEYAEELNVEKEGYAVVGFSAGGHLAASFGAESLGYLHYGLPKPGALFLAYPVVTMGKWTHAGSRENLSGIFGVPQEEWISRYSVEKQITENYPPAFVWQCEHDNEVPIENTGLLAAALQKAGVPYSYRTYPGDAHGWGCAEGTAAQGWLELAVDFWEKNRE